MATPISYRYPISRRCLFGGLMSPPYEKLAMTEGRWPGRRGRQPLHFQTFAE